MRMSTKIGKAVVALLVFLIFYQLHSYIYPNDVNRTVAVDAVSDGADDTLEYDDDTVGKSPVKHSSERWKKHSRKRGAGRRGVPAGEDDGEYVGGGSRVLSGFVKESSDGKAVYEDTVDIEMEPNREDGTVTVDALSGSKASPAPSSGSGNEPVFIRIDPSSSGSIKIVDANASSEDKSSKSGGDASSSSSAEQRWAVDPLAMSFDNSDDNSTLYFIPDSEESLESRLQEIGGEVGYPILLRLFKEESSLEVWMLVGDSYRKLKGYTICEYSGGLGPRRTEGDNKSPEGFYEAGKDMINPDNLYRYSIYLGYPNQFDREQNATGSDVSLHEGCFSAGSFAMGDDGDMEEIFDLAVAAMENGQESLQIQIYPFTMSEEELKKHEDSQWYSFWKNLKEGYDLFDEHHRRLEVGVDGGKYIFSIP